MVNSKKLMILFRFKGFVGLYVTVMALIQYIFRPEYSDYIQFSSFLLEIAGITLACIEIRNRKLAEKIENWFDKSYRFIQKAHNHLLSKGASNLFALFCFLFFFIFLPWTQGVFEYILSKQSIMFVNVMVYLSIPLGIGVLAAIIYALLGEFIKSLNDFHYDSKALGSFGIFLASIGLVGNAYQIITSLVC